MKIEPFLHLRHFFRADHHLSPNWFLGTIAELIISLVDNNSFRLLDLRALPKGNLVTSRKSKRPCLEDSASTLNCVTDAGHTNNT